MKRILPAVLALIESAVTAAGAYCALTFAFFIAWSSSAAHPIRLPVSMVGSFGCLCLFCLVAYFYIRLCMKQKRRWLILADLAIFLLPLLPFFEFWSMIARYLSNAV